MQLTAEGWGESTIVFRDLIAITILKIAVEVGFVDGIIAATTPRGLAISTMLALSETTPTVLSVLKWFQTSSAAKRFFSNLSSAFPKPVSSWASLPRRAAWAKAVSAIA